MRGTIVTTAFLVLISAASTRALPAADLTPPAGSRLIGRYAAAGAQVYTCVAKPEGLTWGPAEPDADLRGTDALAVIHHSKGPTWQTGDGSKVIGSVVASQQAPASGAVPWLLLSATATDQGRLAGTKFVTRQDTAGGSASGEKCRSAGMKSRVPYTATYAFYR